MGETILYTVLAVFAVYGVYAAVREIVILITCAFGKDAENKDSCSICMGCRKDFENAECKIQIDESNEEDGDKKEGNT